MKLYRDGNMFCALSGPDMQSGVCGFGRTRIGALWAWVRDGARQMKR